MKKLVSLLVVLSVVFSLCACAKKEDTIETSMPKVDVDIAVNEAGEIIEVEDVTWYDFREFQLEEEYQDPHYSLVVNDFISADDSCFSSFIYGFETSAEVLDSMHQREFCHLVKYDYVTGERVFFADLSDYQRFISDGADSIEYRCVAALEGEDYFYAFYTMQDFGAGEYNYHILKLDKTTGDVVEDYIPENFNSRMDVSAIVRGTAVDGNKIVLYTASGAGLTNGRFIVYDVLTDEVSSCPLGVKLQANDATVVGNLYRIDSTLFCLTAYDSSSNLLCLLLDTDTMELELLDIENAMSEIDDSISNLSFGTATNSYLNDFTIQGSDYVASLNPDSLKFEVVFDLNHCAMNGTQFNENTGTIAIFDDCVIMTSGAQGRDYDGAIAIYRINTSENNPYEGRILLTASALVRDVNSAESEIIFRFNDSQDQYYIAIDNSYVPGDSSDYYFHYGDYVTETAEMTSRLQVDLMAGDGPDIILDGFDFIELNNDSCLVDLAPYFEGSDIYDDEVYFSNAFNLAKDENGAIYQMPISICLSGINTGVNFASEYTRTGFTFDEYASFVTNECNGYDPLSMDRSQIDYFLLCFNNMRDRFISDGRIDLDNEDFHSLAEYCFNNVNAPYTVDEFYNSSSPHRYIFELSSYNRLPLYGETNSLAGIPSCDGRGPSIRCLSSVGVAASCTNVGGALDFINFALSEDSQNLICRRFGGESLIRSAEIATLYRLVDSIEAEREVRELQDPGFPVETATYSDADTVVELYSVMIDSACGYFGGDSDISLILYEEMPAYFSGDKSLDEVIDIVEDRAQTVLNERG